MMGLKENKIVLSVSVLAVVLALRFVHAESKKFSPTVKDYFKTGHAAMSKGDEKGVVTNFTKAYEKANTDTDKAIALNNIGYYFLTHGDITKAQEYLEMAAALDKTNKKAIYRAHIWNSLGQIYEFKKEYPKALSCYCKACAADSTEAKPQMNKERLEKMLKEMSVPNRWSGLTKTAEQQSR